MQQSNARTHVDVTADELPMHCPTPDTALWNSHPRVYIPLDDTPEAACAYCGTIFRLVRSRDESLDEGTVGAQVAGDVDAIGDVSLTSSSAPDGSSNAA